MKYAILIGDGMADYPIDELGGKTPLEAAHTPNMDHIARQGVGGLVRTIPKGKAPGSDVANLEILGYDSMRVLTGRAPLEAASMGIELADHKVAFRCNLITVTEDRILDYSAGHITTKEGTQLIAEIQERLGSHRVRFYPGVSYRHLMVMRDGPERIETVPPHDVMGERPEDHLPQGDSAAFIRGLMTNSVQILKEDQVNRQRIAKGELPATQIWLWGSGKALRLPALKDRFGVTGGVISAVDLLKGIGISAGLRVIDVPGITGYLDTNYSGKAQAALESLKENDFVFVHVEAPDEAGHQGNIKDKLQAIEDFDQKIVKPVFEGMQQMAGNPDFRLVVCMDHLTPISIRTHADQPVPMLLYDSRQTGPQSGVSYTERNGEESGTLLSDGKQFFNKLLEREGTAS
ncbi:MAG: cofactor-independent phosphoglycerate mutase [Candidatus Latescibacteria bacterium]|nr:cofactor-independent phosphoglycerate mutase [Candidatus Latescibacterota bacterium]